MKTTTYDIVKRAIDITGSLVGLIVTSPIQLAIAGIVKRRLGPPVFFRQHRPGKDGRLFTLIKFRTMQEPDTESGAISDADRLTALGRFLRSTSLDELPTLWNVFKGDMSLIGPRPLLPNYLPLYSPRQSLRHTVRPGVTGLAQTSGRNRLSWEERLELDVQYIEHRSFFLDARIALRTLTTVMLREGISHPGHSTMQEFTGTSADTNPEQS